MLALYTGVYVTLVATAAAAVQQIVSTTPTAFPCHVLTETDHVSLDISNKVEVQSRMAKGCRSDSG